MPVNAFPKSIYTNDSLIDYFNPLDLTDGSWTFVDTPGLINSTTYAPGVGNTITLNNFPVANDQAQLVGSGGTCVAPRWYKLAYYDDGTPVLGGDAFYLIVSSALKGSTAGSMRYFNYALGVCEDPTSTSVTTIKYNGAGVAWNFANTDADTFPAVFSETLAGNAAPLSAADTRSVGTIAAIGGLGGLTSIGVDPSGVAENNGVLLWQSSLISAATHLSLCFMAGPRGTTRTYAAGDQTKAEINYKFVRINPVSAGF